MPRPPRYWLRSIFFLCILSVATNISISHGSNVPDLGITFLFGVPHPINLGVDHRTHPKWSYGATVGIIGIQLPNQPIRISMTNLEARGRWHPFSGTFILGGILGHHNLTAKASKDFIVQSITVPTTISLTIKSLYLTPHLGWFWTWNSGFTLGLELGVQIPMAPSSSLSTSIDDATLNNLLDIVKQTSAYKDLESDIETQSNRLAKIIFPYVTVLRLGWAF